MSETQESDGFLIWNNMSPHAADVKSVDESGRRGEKQRQATTASYAWMIPPRRATRSAFEQRGNAW